MTYQKFTNNFIQNQIPVLYVFFEILAYPLEINGAVNYLILCMYNYKIMLNNIKIFCIKIKNNKY
jgi:hypothetical protein